MAADKGKEPKRPWGVRPKTALERFIDTVDVTGGVFSQGGYLVPEADPEWVDLGGAYVEACSELGIEPFVRREA